MDETFKMSLERLKLAIILKLTKGSGLKTMVPFMGLLQLKDVQKLKAEIDTEIDKLVAGDIRFSGLKFQRDKMWKEAQLIAISPISTGPLTPMNIQLSLMRYFDLQADYIKKWL